jgi:hypothetical protein
MCFIFISDYIFFIVVILNDVFSCSGYMTSYATHSNELSLTLKKVFLAQ